MNMADRRTKEESNACAATKYRSKSQYQLAFIATFIGMFGLLFGSVFLSANSSIELNRLRSHVLRMQTNFKEQATEMESRFRRSLESTRTRLEKASDKIHHMEKRSAESAPVVITANQDEVPEKPSGAIFTRWGRRDCPTNSSKLVYEGYVAGALYSHTGGVSDYMCLHDDISYIPGKFVSGTQGSSYLYGVEYRDTSWVNNLFDLSLTESGTIQYHSVPCSICLANHAHTEIMIPGEENCPDGWEKQYIGYIMSTGHSDKHPTSPICVDEQPQVVPGTQGSQTGGFLFMVETICTSLLCEPFVAGRELRCVVCTI